MSRPFAVRRANGRSNTQVVIDVVHAAAPGTLFTHAALLAALNEGSPRAHDAHDLSGIVARANKRLLREHQRRLHAVIGLGYRLAPAAEQRLLARTHERRRDTQSKWAVETLRHVRWDEMDPESRKAHEAHLMVTEAIYQTLRAQERRLRKVEQAIAAITAGTAHPLLGPHA